MKAWWHLQQLAFVCAIALATVGATAAKVQAQAPVALPGCNHTCGNVVIPYPFGMGNSSVKPHQNCFLDHQFDLTCQNSTLIRGKDIPILGISLEGYLEANFPISSVCFNASGLQSKPLNYSHFQLASYTISSKKNKFFSVGCDTYGFLRNFRNGKNYTTGCLTRCNTGPDIQKNETCSGIGCCEVDIPHGMKNITIRASSFSNYTNVTGSFNRCSYSFVQKLDEDGFGYKLTSDHIKYGLPFNRTPVVLDWVAGNQTCEVAKKSSNYTCKSNNSNCSNTDYGYTCQCETGYNGNPYLLKGCQDINECANRSTHNCISNNNCRNTDGSFECFCNKWYSGKGTKEGGCQAKILLVMVVTSAGFIALLVGMSATYLVYHKRKLTKLKEKFFRQNGGFILQQQLSEREDSSQSRARIFTVEELKKATKDYDESLIIGKGGYGIVFKGLLTDNRIVAVKKAKLIDESQIEQFINEVVVLSQINHRNVVKLLGCCLETEVPLLVYEFVNNGTLYDYIHNESKANNVSWTTRLRIAAEAAGALAYLHSAASIPIIHRDVKTANILLDETYTAKVSDFGASRLVPVGHAEIATIVQGTLGYLDPEYMQTNQLTEKSDVYSFGVVLVELLTSEKALSFDRPEEKRSLSMYFLSSFKEGCLFEVLENGLVNEENKADVMEVAVLASKCLRLTGEERPSMKEVAMELEGIIRMMNKHSRGNGNIEPNLEETEYLLHDKSGISEHGHSSSHHNTGYDSIRDHVLSPINDGR